MAGEQYDDSAQRASLQDLDRAPVSLPQPEGTPDNANDLAILRERFNEVVQDRDRIQGEFDALKRGSSTIAELDKLIAPSAKKAFNYMSVYSVGVFYLLVMDGCHFHGFDLQESVLDFLVGSTAVTVLGLVGMVLTGIFIGARRAVTK
ncbi:hypothetical protein [Sphingomonas nostoxanthinifaciens]|uniref:hypothetical protein n=1 Tax=Sphingomonas nostoxanthinifaciens TaxID=2872652 RepID=UPI001CC21DD0|nr:hypothetical protein [Sphingomonas nostoxanthinifaciens]UAK25841.1 hypothetical protein K8P63_06875 [Sphingomonas nostoxanthinifaciens]